MKLLENKWALVTGSSRGIGQQIAHWTCTTEMQCDHAWADQCACRTNYGIIAALWD